MGHYSQYGSDPVKRLGFNVKRTMINQFTPEKQANLKLKIIQQII